MDLDDEGRLKNIFWADPRSRAAYQYFGDVVTFDTTYLTNRYGMPFAPFVGINHHGQSILLGVWLISSEDTETFTWSFQIWLQCMDGIASKAIITDQDRAMKNTIATVFPETRHRLSLWHILKKVPEKFGSYAAYRSGLKTRLMKCVYNTQTIEEFEKCWAEFINTYDLHENPWFKSLYAECEHWVPVFLKDHFWAGMSTTQRNESMNAFFDGYVHSKTNLKKFVDQFDNALKKKIENENHAEFKSFSQVIPYVSRSLIEKKFQEFSLPIIDSNAGYMTLDTTAVAGSQQVKSPLVVRGKGKPPSLRRASRMETNIRKEALDSIEFARRDPNSRWGSMRAAMGHPEPFDLRHVALGNDGCGNKKNQGFCNYLVSRKVGG
ncbi:hypothetical protein F2P56_035720 [Juglans regia]|uniref:Protein FAR1-RELATED SEQUENCE n=2 Tax=Juglans regia TaxID=51240 RepID=A0A833TMT3_JUGRE|nr:protein FAR1-RELATED SEQUENCE 5-like [Juglans regia]KAF5443133.1 hypothetical protein F2P56_035721 [Juglans regia]KAF5443134.1 hypothetical protein F2P56_035720 [Juglans regia]